MRTLKLYIDTSVIGGYFDQEFEEETKALFDKVKQNEYSIVLSDLTERELLGSPENVKMLLKYLGIIPEIVLMTTEVDTLAEEYLSQHFKIRFSRPYCDEPKKKYFCKIV